MKNPFDYFDKIYCICGKHETDRWVQCCEQFEKLGIMDRVERYPEFPWNRGRPGDTPFLIAGVEYQKNKTNNKGED